MISRKQKLEEFESNLSDQFTEEQYPIHEAAYSSKLFEVGIGSVLLSRTINTQTIAISIFLLDVYCLGVKNAFFKVESKTAYNETKQQLFRNDPIKGMSPSCARKLVEEGVSYAEKIGFSPHKDFKKAKRIFGNIDPKSCKSNFTYGKYGKPFFVSGPNETPQQCKEIVEMLERNCGSGNYEYIIQVEAPPM
ncbi:hypothetical protein ES703_83089 [subsurface metagenome]